LAIKESVMMWNKIISGGYTELELVVWWTDLDAWVQDFYLEQGEVVKGAFPGAFIFYEEGVGWSRGRRISLLVNWVIPGKRTDVEILSVLEKEHSSAGLKRVLSVNAIVGNKFDENWPLMWNPETGIIK